MPIHIIHLHLILFIFQSLSMRSPDTWQHAQAARHTRKRNFPAPSSGSKICAEAPLAALVAFVERTWRASVGKADAIDNHRQTRWRSMEFRRARRPALWWLCANSLLRRYESKCILSLSLFDGFSEDDIIPSICSYENKTPRHGAKRRVYGTTD